MTILQLFILNHSLLLNNQTVMEQKKLNIILFNSTIQQDQITSQKNKKSIESSNNQQSLKDLFSQINQINAKIDKIFISHRSTKQKMQSFKVQINSNRVNSSELHTNRPENKNDNNYEDILDIMQKKLLILIQQSNRIIEQLKNEVEKAINRQLKNRFINFDTVKEELERTYKNKLKQTEKRYFDEIKSIRSENQQYEKAYESRLEKVENKLITKIKEQEKNEQALRKRIKELQEELFKLNTSKIDKSRNQYNTTNNKSKKQHIIQVQQQKQNGSTCSRVRRKKIFEKKKEDNNNIHSNSPIKTIYSDLNSLKLLNKQLDQFEDLKSDSLVDSDQDVFFYPEVNNNNKQKTNKMLENSSCSHLKVFSPFDVN